MHQVGRWSQSKNESKINLKLVKVRVFFFFLLLSPAADLCLLVICCLFSFYLCSLFYLELQILSLANSEKLLHVHFDHYLTLSFSFQFFPLAAEMPQ